LKNTLGLLGLLIFLSITIQKKTVFNHIYSVTSPITIAAQDAAEDLVFNSYRSANEYTRKFFDNSVPKVKDTVSSQISAIKKNGLPEEIITIQEKNELNHLIKNKR
jgi:hypothetical protein